MLPKENRLKIKKDFEKVFKKGRRFKEDFLVFIVVKNNLKQSRFGFIVSNKVSKKATVRNKIKRRLRKLVKESLLRVKEGIDCVIIASPGFEVKDFWEIEKTINIIFTSAKILKTNSAPAVIREKK